ncbi:MAG: Trm112 family protein [Terracidiphilus sp.]
MPAQSASDSDLDRVVLATLACPACHGDLRLNGARLICTCCHGVYPIIEGVPVLIAERADSIARPRR